jgi:LPS export ABC transporter protein LptC
MSFWEKYSIYTLIILIVFLFFGCKSEKTIVEETPPISGQAIEEFSITQTDKGKIKMMMESKSASINESKNIAYLKLPIIKFYDKGKYVSTLIMEEAEINMLTYDVNGIGKCTVDSANNECLQTSDLSYDAEKELVYSDHDVKIIRPGETVYGTSFKSDIKLDKIIIKNQRTIIE